MTVAYSYTETLPVTKTYPVPGQRVYTLTSPGVMKWNEDGTPAETCMAQVVIQQLKGRTPDLEGYYLREATDADWPVGVPPGPNERGFVFECYTAEPTEQRPGIYLVRVTDNEATWCGCLGARGHIQQSDCKHRDVITHSLNHVIEG